MINEELDKKFKFANGITIGGLTSELNVLYVARLFNKLNSSLLVVTSSLYVANIFYNLMQTYLEDVLLFPMDDFLTSVLVAESPELRLTRLETLKKLKNGNHLVITNLMGYLKYLPNQQESLETELNLDQTIKRQELINILDKYGYHRESITSSTGEYSIRGFIIDVFLVHEEHPIRIELEDDLITNIRYFDETTQLSTSKINTIIINPIKEMLTNKKSSLLDYINGSNVVFIDNEQIKATNDNIVTDVFEYQKSKQIKENIMYSLNELQPKYVTYLEKVKNAVGDKAINYNTTEIDNYNSDFNALKEDINIWQKGNKNIYICLSNDKEYKELQKENLNANLIKTKINKGFIFDSLVVISDNDLEKTSHETYKYKNAYKFGKKIKSYSQLEKGDYVVHPLHGIGIYNGLVSLTKNKVAKDYIQILYADKDKIYVPVEKISNIYKYGDSDGIAPKINKLNSSAWVKTRSYLANKVKDISSELLTLYHERLKVTNIAYKRYPEQDIFASEFNYTLTIDQQRSIEDILHDLESNHPMDRLLCGDVGFGKTEVAFEAMFSAVCNNEQVMYLCPTTILSKQQFEVALKRFNKWPVNIAVLNRFVTLAQTHKILEDLENGKIDIIFGTHRLLSKDVKFQRLGLLVVDEEQRFGVTHKEKIKEYKNNINVLTLSATPIPRTLKMALSGIRDLSIINTAPVNRYPVQTYVINEDELIIKDAIYKELSRNGQVFILYNHIDDIQNKVYKIKSLIPEAEVRYAHGQMKKDELEDIMNDFTEQKFPILVCTTIIENGIDIPNVNTLIIFESDRFGLSQLYQIRGRVGRSDKIAYCYLTYNSQKVLGETAVKRLNAIKEFTELGSGYKIAMRDLSIRGAGDIFGSSQAGFVDSVGIAFYLKMMDDEIRRQKGEEIIEDDFDNESLLNVETHISDNYIMDEDVKIEIHSRINEIDSLAKFNEVKKELEDRFGQVDKSLENYMYEEWFESLARKYGIKKVEQTDRFVEIEFPGNISREIKGDKLLIDACSLSRNFTLKYVHDKIYVNLNLFNLEDNYVVYLVKLLDRIELKSIE